MEIRLERFCYGPTGTFGRLVMDGFECYTVERPWAGNLPGISCIPEGDYVLQRDTFKGQYENFRIVSPVPGRSDIEMHIGNTMDSVRGCIALGNRLGWIAGKWAVTDSTVTFQEFMEAMSGVDRATLSVFFKRQAPRITGDEG